MKDYTRIKDQKNGNFVIQRELTEEVTKEDLEQQLQKLEHTKEQMLDELETIDVRIDVIKTALEKGYSEGDTTLARMRMPI